MAYVKINNGAVEAYPYGVGQLKRDNPAVSFPKEITEQVLNGFSVYAVSFEPDPDYDPKTQNVVAAEAPVLVDGVWTVTKSVTNKTDEEVQGYNDGIAFVNREKRDRLLTETDWWAVSDRTMTSEQTAYRQALRDITAHANWPHLNEDDWPTKP